MGEFYAVRVSGNKKTYYKTKSDYEKGKLASFGNTNKRLKKANAI
nr:MAG TPA: hypothetical protein [Caudoviricetes sp.]DAS17178.1 MAG TPA: hypothetical protein [Caudoviricetes sp.]